MQTLVYIEDLVSLLHRKIVNYEIVAQHQDIGPISNFSRTIDAGKMLTRKQGTFIVQLLKKYRSGLGVIDIDDILKNPVFKNDFRVIDTSKYIYLETDSDGVTWLNVKFPYSFKDQFVKDIFNGDRDPTRWDPETQSRKVKLSEINLVMLIENASKHGFEIDERVLDALAYIEELWNNEETLVPYSLLDGETVSLVNASESALAYWNEHKTENTHYNLILAKQMGFLLKDPSPSSTAAQIASRPDTGFWFSDQGHFFRFIDELQMDPVVIVLDRTPEPVDWVRQFVEDFPLKNYSLDDVRVCFRPANNSHAGQEFNNWLKSKNLSKPVADGKIFLCQHKPPKWMFEKDFDIKIVASNSIYPSVNNVTGALIGSTPNIFYFDKVKPAPKRNLKIVEL